MGLIMRLGYQIEEGDTMLDICQRFKISFADIFRLNPEWIGRDMNIIRVGELIRIQ